MTARRQVRISPEQQQQWSRLLEVCAQETFELMLGCPGIPVSDGIALVGLDVLAVVGFSGEVSGIFSVRCSANSACVMAAKMLGLENEEARAEMWDAVGEVCNLFAGNFKHHALSCDPECSITVPTVISSQDYRIEPAAGSFTLSQVLQLEGSPVVFALEVHP